MKISSYQQRIIDWVKNGKGNACCNAVAGSGKSTTLRLAAAALEASGISPNQIKVCVFGKANAQDLISKFGKNWESSISTLHSAGWQLIKSALNIQNTRGLIKNNKYKKIAQDLQLISSSKYVGKLNNKLEKENDFIDLIDLVRLTLVSEDLDKETLQDICNHFEIGKIDDYVYVVDAINDVLQTGEALANDAESFDFTDQIWLPNLWQLTKEKWFNPYQFLLIDECQDLNAAQLALVLSLAGENGRLLFVGDPKQAIMGFAGADCNSYQNILEKTGAIELPLSTCYRCPQNHIELVKKNFPEIKIEACPEQSRRAKSEAPSGKIEVITEDDLWGNKSCRLVEGDMVLSRKTAPLVSLCIKLISKGIAATVKGKSIGEQLKGTLKEIAKIPLFEYANFNSSVNIYRDSKKQRYKGLDNEEQLIVSLNDKLSALIAIYRSQPQANSISDLENYIDTLFSDEHSPIILSTCHRAKGLEGDRIFIIKPEDMPMRWRNQQSWQKQQEDNLLYVALTRSKSELYIVGNPKWFKEEPVTVNILQSENEAVKIQDQEITTTVNSLQNKIEITLLNPEWQLKSDRAIATHLGTSAPTIAKYRRRLQAAGKLTKADERIDAHGRKLKTENIGTKAKTKEKIMLMATELEPVQIQEIIDFLKTLLKD